MLEVRHLSKSFGPVQALRDVTFHIGAGEVLGLIGPNGAGKSTAFQCLAGLLPADAGAVFDGEREVEPERRSSVLMFLPDGITLWGEQRVAWTLDFAADAFRARGDWRGDIASVLRLKEIGARRVSELSRGQRKRVLLAIAFMTPQPVTLLDEPFDGLDLRHAREVSTYLHALTRDGRTLFLSIHPMSDAARLCDRLVLLNEGSVAAEGTLAELRERSKRNDLEDVFLTLTESGS